MEKERYDAVEVDKKTPQAPKAQDEAPRRQALSRGLPDRELAGLLSSGAVIVYPTDTIYGIGCTALDERTVKRLRAIKGRGSKPFSIIAPGKAWIRGNCLVSRAAAGYLKKLPGPYTLILPLKRKCVAPSVAPDSKALGVRIPKHWFASVVAEAGVPFVTTSVNPAGAPHMTSVEDADAGVLAKADYLVYEGPKRGKPSRVIDFTGASPRVKR
jgi:tRNA threonylcarbamoyl adenosine modification protein (Sua5/YciO/YrdC/YwlC family)